jgi:hypothetical protein
MELEALLALTEGPIRTAALVAWVQRLYSPGNEPVLVGGAAVELYTGGAYVTGDLDFVGDVPPPVARKLTAAGFAKRGRHWVHEPGQVFIEFPGDALAQGELAARLRAGEHEVILISLEDALADRLAAWKHWKSIVDGVNSWLLFRAQEAALDRRRMRARAVFMQAEDAWDALLALRRSIGRRAATSEEIERWAQCAP